MGRISEEAQNDVNYYADKIDDKHNIKSEYPRLTDIYSDVHGLITELLHSRAEVDAVFVCIEITFNEHHKYNFSLVSAPKDPARRAKAFAAISDDPSEVSYMNQMEPLSSQTMNIKHQVIDEITFVLKDANIGKNRRKKIIPMLISHILMGGGKLDPI